MSESTGTTGERRHQKDPAPAGASARSGPGRLPVIAVVLAVIAVAIALWALLQKPAAPAAPAAPAPAVVTSQQIADAKARACGTFTEVRAAVALQTHANLGTDATAVQAVAANARLAMYGGGSYLTARLDPATPGPLAQAIHSFANDLQDIAIGAMSGVGNDDPAQIARLRDGETVSTQIADLCK